MKRFWLTSVLLPALATSVLADPPDEKKKGDIPQDVTGTFLRPSRSLLGDFYDAGFDRHVDVVLLGQAWSEMDPALLTDVALQMVEAERVLLRPHKHLPAEKLLAAAAKVASEKRDAASLDRLSKIAARMENKALAGQILAAKKLAGESRAFDAALSFPVAKASVEAFAAYSSFVKDIETAKILGDHEELDRMKKEVEKGNLPPEQQEHLKKYIFNTMASLPKSEPADKTTQALNQLAFESRGWVQKVSGGHVSTPTVIQNATPFRPNRNDGYFEPSHVVDSRPAQPQYQQPPRQMLGQYAEDRPTEGQLSPSGLQVYRNGRWQPSTEADKQRAVKQGMYRR
jgi:hypothetical protein